MRGDSPAEDYYLEPVHLGDVSWLPLPPSLGRPWKLTTTCSVTPSWLCFSLGRPSSFPESEMRVPLPTEQKLMQSLATLAHIMSKCATLIYKQKHKSLGPIWTAANEIRRELLAFAEKQRKDLNFGLVGDPNAGELGVCQTIVSTSECKGAACPNEVTSPIEKDNTDDASIVYHHTMVLTFRPFMILRAKLRQERACSRNTAVPGSSSGASLPSPPPWLDKACEYCLEATKHCIAFLAGACEQNVLCRVGISPPLPHRADTVLTRRLSRRSSTTPSSSRARPTSSC